MAMGAPQAHAKLGSGARFAGKMAHSTRRCDNNKIPPCSSAGFAYNVESRAIV